MEEQLKRNLLQSPKELVLPHEVKLHIYAKKAISLSQFTSAKKELVDTTFGQIFGQSFHEEGCPLTRGVAIEMCAHAFHFFFKVCANVSLCALKRYQKTNRQVNGFIVLACGSLKAMVL